MCIAWASDTHYLYIVGLLIFRFIFFCFPCFECTDSVCALYMDARYRAFGFRFVEFFVDEFVAEVDSVGIFFGVAVVNAANPRPVECAQTHRAWFA